MKRIFIIVSVLAVLGLCSCTQHVGLGEAEDDSANTYEQIVEETQTEETTADVAPTEETTIDEPIAELPTDVEVVETPIDETPAVEEEEPVVDYEPEVVIPGDEITTSTEHHFIWTKDSWGLPIYACEYCGVYYLDPRRINQSCIEH